MKNNRPTGESLYIAWKLNNADALAAGHARNLLAQGEGNQLYRLHSWVIVNGEARALLVPKAPLEQIAGAIWAEGDEPLRGRWIAGARSLAATAREIETAPVQLGLATRPEQWPFSSASAD